MIISEKEFKEVPFDSKELMDIPVECESCGADLRLYEVTRYPLCENPIYSKYFQAYCPKCDAYYHVKKTHVITKLRQ